MVEDADNSEARDMAIVKSHALQLSEHFDSVQILVTRHNGAEENTASISYGCGNWFSRYGQAREFVVKSEARARKEVEDEDQDGDEGE